MNKNALRAAILAKLQAELQQQTDAANLARDEAISEESRPENKYDTHSQEAAYLAEGQARLAAEIAQSIEQYSAVPVAPLGPDAVISLGAVVSVTAGRSTSWYFLGPRAGGLEVTVEGRDILVITPQSPLGRQLLGRRAGDPVTLPGRSGAGVIASVE